MQKVINSNEFISFKNILNEIIKKLNDVKNDVNVDINVKYNLNKYNEIIEGSDSDVLTQYETWYDQLSEVIINNTNAIKQSNEAKEQLNELVEFIINSKVNDNMEDITNKEIENNNLLKETLNSLVDKMIDKETIIFNKNENEIKKKEEERIAKEKEEMNQRKQEFDEKLKNINEMKYQLNIFTPSIEKLYKDDNEINELIPSFNKLKEWNDKQNCSVIFDSKIDGDGKGVLANKVINKKNLYFISFDDENNVFGGYVNTIINKTDDYITDPNAFTFSLIRNGKMKNIKYNIKNDHQQYAFYLWNNDSYLYHFGGGGDVFVSKLGESSSYCNPQSSCITYEYNDDQQALRDNPGNSNKFLTKRILVIEMS